MRSEMILHRKLDLPQLADAANSSESRGRSCVRAAPTRARAAPRRMVGRVEHLHAELESTFFGDSEVFHQGRIHVPDAGTDQIVAAAIAELPGERIGKGLPDEISVGSRAIRHRADAGAVEPVAVRHD